MLCTMCNNKTERKVVDYELHLNGDHIVIPVEADVCVICGEKYFDDKTVERLQKVKNLFKRTKRSFQEIGTVFKVLQ